MEKHRHKVPLFLAGVVWGCRHLSRLEGEPALGYIAEYSGKYANERVPNSLVDHRQVLPEQFDQYIGKQDKGHSGYKIPEQLYAAMQVRFREHNMPRHNKTRRKADGKCHYPGHHFRRDGHTPKQVYRQPVQYMIKGDRLNNNIEHGIRPAAGKVPEGLRRYPTGKRPVAKINDTYYDMSGCCKQSEK